MEKHYLINVVIPTPSNTNSGNQMQKCDLGRTRFGTKFWQKMSSGKNHMAGRYTWKIILK